MADVTPAETPNPNAMRFALSVMLPEMVNATQASEAAGTPFAEALFALDGVVNVYGTADFVSVSKRPAASWDDLLPAITEILRTHL